MQTKMTGAEKKSLWHRISGPVKIGLAFGLLGVILATIGMLRGFAPMTFRAFATAILVSGLSWGIVSWAIAAAAAEVERDVDES
jgi:hypothetical protein